MTPTTDADLLAVLERARAVGFLGPGPLRVHLEHARNYAPLILAGAEKVIDLGSGGGLPGLPLFVDRPELAGVLLDAAQKRGSFLLWALAELGLTDRVTVVVGRAEEVAHDPNYRSQFDAVVCRGFGPPAITVECSVGYLGTKGRLLISDPPERRAWNETGLAELGVRHVETTSGVALFERTGPLDDALPRSARAMKRSPAFVLRDP